MNRISSSKNEVIFLVFPFIEEVIKKKILTDKVHLRGRKEFLAFGISIMEISLPKDRT